MKRILFLLSVALCVTGNMFAQKSAVFVSDNAAIHGYDAVAYFKESKPVKGTKEFSLDWNNATWYFSNKENMESFKKAPEKYAPQYGGYCAYGTSEGHKAPTEPDAWAIVNGKLYFNYNKDVQTMWLKDKEERIKTADKKWVDIKDKE